jgi:hypothetical protein
VGGWMFIENIAEMGIEKIDEEIKFNNDVFWYFRIRHNESVIH